MKTQKQKNNVLDLLLGRYIQIKRNKYNLTLSSLADHLGYGISSMKMIESGHMTLGLSKIDLLIYLFNEDTIRLSQLSKYIFGSVFINKKLNEGYAPMNSFKLLGDSDEEFKFLFNHVHDNIVYSEDKLFELTKGSKKELLLVSQIEKFISSVDYINTPEIITDEEIEIFLNKNPKAVNKIIRLLYTLLIKKIKS